MFSKRKTKKIPKTKEIQLKKMIDMYLEKLKTLITLMKSKKTKEEEIVNWILTKINDKNISNVLKLDLISSIAKLNSKIALAVLKDLGKTIQLNQKNTIKLNPNTSFMITILEKIIKLDPIMAAEFSEILLKNIKDTNVQAFMRASLLHFCTYVANKEKHKNDLYSILDKTTEPKKLISYYKELYKCIINGIDSKNESFCKEIRVKLGKTQLEKINIPILTQNIDNEEISNYTKFKLLSNIANLNPDISHDILEIILMSYKDKKYNQLLKTQPEIFILANKVGIKTIDLMLDEKQNTKEVTLISILEQIGIEKEKLVEIKKKILQPQSTKNSKPDNKKLSKKSNFGIQ